MTSPTPGAGPAGSKPAATGAEPGPAGSEPAANRVEPAATGAEAGAEPVPEAYPTFSEQVAGQLGGARGMVESSVPVFGFVGVNAAWSVRPALVIAVLTALAIAAFRLSRRQPIRHAVNGLLGIGIGALIAWRTGSAKDFYLPGILVTLGYAVAMIVSVTARRPLVGWLWCVVADRGSTRWRDDARLRHTFGRLTLLWAGTLLAKAAVNFWVYFADALSEVEKANILGVMRIVLGFPPYALLVVLTIWAVRRHGRLNPTVAAV